MALEVISQVLTNSWILKICMTEDMKKSSGCCHSNIERQLKRCYYAYGKD